MGVMAIYQGTVAKEYPIYGGSRLGVYFKSGNTTVYQLTDHLGNVRALIEESGTLAGATDYYPGGMAMPGRRLSDAEGYRYGYQGEFAETDEETGKPAFELRLYDPRINRWLSPDPMGEFYSPYLAMGNNWRNTVDPTGGQTDCPDCPDPPIATVQLDEVVVTAGNGSWTSEITDKYGYSGTFDMWKQEFNRTGSFLQERMNWEAEHGQAWNRLTSQWDREAANERLLQKLMFFTGAFSAIGQVVSPGVFANCSTFWI